MDIIEKINKLINDTTAHAEGSVDMSQGPYGSNILGMVYRKKNKKMKGGAEYTVHESMSRHAAIYKAKNGKWYLELAPNEYGEEYDADLYGPFNSEKEADDYLDNFSNPGGMFTDQVNDLCLKKHRTDQR